MTEHGVSPAPVGGATAPDPIGTIRSVDGVLFILGTHPDRGRMWWPVEGGGLFPDGERWRQDSRPVVGAVPGTPAERRSMPRRPVHGAPGIAAEWDEDADAMRIDGIGWDLSWGCKLSLCLDHETGEYYVSVCTSGEDQRGGITTRRTTKEQLVSFGQQLLNVFGELDPRDAEIERLRGALRQVMAERDRVIVELEQVVTEVGGDVDFIAEQRGKARLSVVSALRQLEEQRDEAIAERDRLRADLDLVGEAALSQQALRVHITNAANALGLTVAEKPDVPAEPRRWAAGDPMPEIGTTIRRGQYDYTRYEHGWSRTGDFPFASWVWMTNFGELVEVVGTDG